MQGNNVAAAADATDAVVNVAAGAAQPCNAPSTPLPEPLNGKANLTRGNKMRRC